MTQDDIDFSGGDVSYNGGYIPYWRYTYIPDASSSFIAFGQPGHASPPRNISNGGGLNVSTQPTGTPSAFNGVPSQTYRTLNIQGANNNAEPWVDPSGSPQSNPTNQNCVSDVCLNILFSQLSSYNMNCIYSFDLSGEYNYPIDPSVGLSPSEEWGEQYDPSGGDPLPNQTFETVSLTSNTWNSNNLSGSNHPNSNSNTFILPGYTYYISNYRMKLTGASASQNILSEMYTPGGGGDGTNNAVSYVPIVIKPPDRGNLQTQYDSYLDTTPLYTPNPTDTHAGTAYTPLQPSSSAFYAANSSNIFGNTVFFFDDTTDYTFTLNDTPRRCILNKVSSTSGYPNDTCIGKKLADLSQLGVPRTTKFDLDVKIGNQSKPNHNLSTNYAEAWGSTTNINASNTFHEIQTSAPKDAYTTTTSGIQYDRLHGWYMGIDLSAATSTDICLNNYPDICNNTPPYAPYKFILKQEIDTNVSNTGAAVPSQVGQSSEYDLYIGKKPEQDISWNPTPFTALTTSDISLSPQFFGMNLPNGGSSNPTTSTNIVSSGIDLSGDLVQIDTAWRPDNTILTGSIRYYTATSSSQPLANPSVTISDNWVVPQTEIQGVNEQANIKISNLMTATMNYSRLNGHLPQFKFAGTHKNNLLRTPSDITLTDTNGSDNVGIIIGTGVTGQHLWWDYSWGDGSTSSIPIAWNGSSGPHFKSGFIGTAQLGNPTSGPSVSGIKNLCVRESANIDELPFNTVDPSGAFPVYNHTEDISYNQSMWAYDEFRGVANTTNNSQNPYIDYTTGIYFGQTNNYNFSTAGEDLSFNYASTGYWFGNGPGYDSSYDPPSGAITNQNQTATWQNIKWLNILIPLPLNSSNQSATKLFYKIEDKNGNFLKLGSQYLVFTKYHAPGLTPYSWTISNQQASRDFTPWFDAMNSGTQPTVSSINPQLGSNQNGVFASVTPAQRALGIFSMKILGSYTSSSSHFQYLRIGILEDLHIGSISLNYQA